MAENKRMGRPPKVIDKNIFEKLCGLQCTLEEVCECLDVTDKTLNSWCRKNYGETFSEVFKKKSMRGKMSLRRSQFKLAERNATMAIWLGKQYLGQRDVQEVKSDVNVSQENPYSKLSLEELKKLAGEV